MVKYTFIIYDHYIMMIKYSELNIFWKSCSILSLRNVLLKFKLKSFWNEGILFNEAQVYVDNFKICRQTRLRRA